MSHRGLSYIGLSTQTPGIAAQRPLGALEKMFWLGDQNRPLHFAIAAEIGGSTRADQWQEALDHVCGQSTLIWSRIAVDEAGAPVFAPTAPGSIPLRVVENAMSEWTTHVAGQLDRPFNASQAPLLRATLLHGADRSIIILSVHHSIADGLSLSFLLRDVLRAFAGEAVQLSTETGSVEHLVTAQRKGLGTPQPMAAPAERSPMPFRPLNGSTARVEALRLTREMTQSLRERARAERSTLHSVLCAAVTSAASAVVPGWSDVPLRVLSPIDVRGRMLNGSEHFGACVTAVVLEDDGPVNDFWSRARSFSDQLEPVKRTESISALVGMVHELVGPISTAQQAGEFLAQGFSAEILLTNLGAVDFKDTYGPLTLRALWGPAVHTGFAMGQTVGAATVGDQLHLLHTSYGPAQGLLGEVSSILDAALLEARPCLRG